MLARAIAFCAHRILRYRKAHVEHALVRAGLAKSNARAVYENLARGLLEWVRARRSLEDVFINDEALAALSHARANGPVVIAASHTGNWELAAYRLAGVVPITVLAKPLHQRWAHAWANRVRARFGVHVVAARDGQRDARNVDAAPLAELVRALRAGRVVVVASDQAPERRTRAHATRGHFMGQRAWLDRTAYALAARAGATVLVTAQRRTRAGHEVSVLTSERAPLRDRATWIDRATQAGARALEAFVYATPESWLWTHRRWKS